MPDARRALAAALGIVASYTDQTKRRRRTSLATTDALLAALGYPAPSDADARAHLTALRAAESARDLPQYWIGIPNQAPDLPLATDADWHLRDEDGETRSGRGSLPPLPLGCHTLHQGADTCTLIIAPRQLPLPDRVWGVTAPLYGLRDAAAGGLADYADLAQAGAAVAAAGGAFLGLNPIHAGFWGVAEFSPYTPSHRRRLNSFHIPTPGADVPPGAALLDYAKELPAKRRALEARFATADEPARVQVAHALRHDPGLARFALHQTLADRHGPYWTDWPAELQNPESRETQAAAKALESRIRFHAWLQLEAQSALKAAQCAMTDLGANGLYLDLAVGTHPAGAETWEDPASFARGVSLGAPPDAFSEEGQRWNLAPLNPRTLITTGFRAFRETVQSLFAHAGAIRIDHILGIDRAFWVPDAPGLPGAYITMPRDALLAILRLEATRAGGVVVGEDLGNVPRGLRGALQHSGVLGCRVAIFEQSGTPPRFRDTARYPKASLASFSTHDLPTWRGWRSGAEIALRQELGDIPSATAETARDTRHAEVAAFDKMTEPHRPEGTDPGSVTALTHGLAAAGSALIAIQAEDIFGQFEQPNLPGTTDSYPNWRHRLPLPAEGWHESEELAGIARIMARHGRGETA